MKQDLSSNLTPQQMSKSERYGSTLMAIARCLFEAKLPRHLWNEIPSKRAYL